MQYIDWRLSLCDWPIHNLLARFRAVGQSHDQKPIHADAKRRVRAAGERIACWQHSIGPFCRLSRNWAPGLAMTWSIRDTDLSEYGINPVAKVSHTTAGTVDKIIVLMRDGVWEFIFSQEVVDLVGHVQREGYPAMEACESCERLVGEAARMWRQDELVEEITKAVVLYMSCGDKDRRSGAEESDKK